MRKVIHILGGGTIFHVRNHLALCAPAYGGTAKYIAELLSRRNGFEERDCNMDIDLHLTRMAGGGLETNDDVSRLADQIIADPRSKIVFFSLAMCDFDGRIGDVESGKYAERLRSREAETASIRLSMAEKVVGRFRKVRKDIFLVAFKTTSGAAPEGQYVAGLHLLKSASANLVLAIS